MNILEDGRNSNKIHGLNFPKEEKEGYAGAVIRKELPSII
jgi:hypothetical protein